jgi:diacylglycerol O-acyltransferase / wax synthase
MVLTRLRMDELVNAWVSDENTPFQIALLGTLDAGPFRRPDGAVDVPRIRRELTARVHRVPALGRRVVWTRLGEGRPVWAADPAFDPAGHVESTTLPPGANLESWAANRVVRPLAPDRPLWRAEVVDGLTDGRFAVIIVLHHVVADGLTGVAMIGSLLDPSADAAPPPPPVAAVPPLPSRRELAQARLHDAAAAIQRLRLPTARSLGRLRRGVVQFRDVLTDLLTPAPATSLPRSVGPGRRLVIVRQPLEDLRRTGHELGVTVNDLLLAAVTGGLRELLIARGEDIAGLVLRTSVPAGAGGPGQVAGMLVVELPVGEPDPVRRLTSLHASAAVRKTRLRAGGGDVTQVLDLPVPVARTMVRWLRRFGGTRVNLFVTDVPGPPAPLWLAGARLLEAVPVAPLVPHVPVGVAALSYAGQLAVSVNTDAAVTDVGVLAVGMTRSFGELRDVATAGGRPSVPGIGESVAHLTTCMPPDATATSVPAPAAPSGDPDGSGRRP